MGALVEVWSHVLCVIYHLCVIDTLMQELCLDIELGEVYGVFLSLGASIYEFWFHCDFSQFFLDFFLGVSFEVLKMFVALQLRLTYSLYYLTLHCYFYHTWWGNHLLVGLGLLVA